MGKRIPLLLWVGTAAGIVLAAAVASIWGGHLGLGLLAGGTWGLASLWCLVHLLDAWLGPKPSRRSFDSPPKNYGGSLRTSSASWWRGRTPRAIGWLLVKFPLLYLALFLLLYSSRVSVAGFGVGFTLVLAVALGGLVALSRRSMSYGR